MQKGAIEITGYISPTSETDTYPTHIDKYGKGGYRSVLTLTDLDDIPLERRSDGMLAYVVDINKLYKLNSNNTWEEFISLPPLGTFTIAGITYPKIYVGTESGVPEASESFGYALVDILALNARFLTGNFIMADALFQPTYPSAQFISNLPDGVIAKTGKTLRGAEGGVDFVDIVDRNLVVEGCIPAWLVSNNKTLRNTRLKIIEGSAQDGDDLQGIRTLIANAMISRGAITSNDSVFGLNNVGTRELKIYDRTDVGAGRLTRSVNFIAAYQLANSVNFYLPETPSSLGKVLADVGETIYDGRLFRKLDFVDIASNSAKYILQVPNQSLPNAQALDTLGLGILKVTAGGVLALAVKDVDYASKELLEEIKAETETFRNEAQAAAEEATGAAEEATASAATATAAAAEATGAAATATAEALAAGISATSAATSAAGAGLSAVAAAASATSASNSATSASNSATSASNSATSASNSATSASNSATSATNSATLAFNSATSATNSANAASVSETNAFNSATNASNSATSASNSASNASNSATIAGEKAVLANVSAIEAVEAKNEAQISAISADEDANAAYMTYQQVLDLFNNFINTQMTTSYANIKISSAFDPNNTTPKFQNFETYYPPESTNTNPKLGTNYAIVDSAFPNTDNFSRIWGILAEMGSETAINSSLKFTFNHKLLSNPFTPFALQLSAGINPGDYISLVDIYSNINLNNNKITNIITTEEGSCAVNRDYLVQYVANHPSVVDISLTGAVTGTLINGVIATTLTPINTSQITNFATSVQATRLDQFAAPSANINLNNYKITGSATPDGTVNNELATVGFVKSSIPTVSLTGAVTGTINSSGIINSTLSQVLNLPGSFINFNWPDIGSYSSPYSLLNFLPNADPAPIFNISSQVGNADNNSLRRWQMNFKQGSTAVVGGEFELSFYHSLLEGDHTITPLRITYSGADSKPRIYMKSILDMYNFPIVGVPTPIVGDGAANKNYVDTKPLNSLPITGNIDFSTYSASSSFVPTAANHLCNKSYIDNKTWSSSFITDFSTAAITSAKTIRLDQFATPTLDISLGGVKFANAADPINGQDFVTKNFLLNTLANGVPITITGAVYGSGVGTVATSLNPIQNITNADNKTILTYNWQPNIAGLISTNQIIIDDTSIATARFVNRISRKTASDNSFEFVNWIDSASTGSSSQIMQMNFVNGNTGVSPAGQTYTFFSATKYTDNTITVDFNANVQVPNGTLSTHAVNKSQLDSKALNTLPVTGDLDLGTYRAISSATPTSGNHLINKTYLDSAIAVAGGVWQTYTPNILASNTNPTLPTGHYIRGSYRVTGKSCLVSIIYTNNGSLTNINNGSGYYIFTLPAGVSIDTTKIYTPDGSADPGYYNAIKASVLGYGIISNGPNQIENTIQVFCSQTQFGIPNGLILFRMTQNIWKTVNNGSFPLNASSWITYQFTAEFPIL